MKKTRVIIAILLCSLLLCLTSCVSFQEDDTPPKIKKGEFPYSVAFTLDGETYTYEGTVACKYEGTILIGGHLLREKREWSEEPGKNILLIQEYDTASIFTPNRTNNCSFVYLCFGKADYYMGEEKYEDTAIPCFYYYEGFTNAEGRHLIEQTVLTEEQLEEYFGIKVTKFDFSSPIKNEYE